MVRLDRSMMERYEIVDRRPTMLRALLFGLDPLMLCGAARLLDRANEMGGNLGAVCISGSDEAGELRTQDGMFTVLIRGEGVDGSPIREERVVQSILEVISPEEGKRFAVLPEIDLFLLPRLNVREEFVESVALLISNMSRHDDITHFRLDRIIECQETEKPVRSVCEVHGLENGLHIPDYMAGRAYMFSGCQELVRIRAKRYLVGDILDWFGMEVRFEKVTDDDLEAIFRADELSLKYWLRQYGEHAERVE